MSLVIQPDLDQAGIVIEVIPVPASGTSVTVLSAENTIEVVVENGGAPAYLTPWVITQERHNVFGIPDFTFDPATGIFTSVTPGSYLFTSVFTGEYILPLGGVLPVFNLAPRIELVTVPGDLPISSRSHPNVPRDVEYSPGLFHRGALLVNSGQLVTLSTIVDLLAGQQIRYRFINSDGVDISGYDPTLSVVYDGTLSIQALVA